MSDTTPPGWHADPYGAPNLLRWWDGRQWTESTAPAQGAAPEPLYGQAPLYGQPPPAEQPPPGGPPRAAGGRGALPWLLAAGAGLVVIVIVVVVTVHVLHGGGDDGNAGPIGRSGTPTATTSPAAARSAVVGTITDDRAQLAYDRLGSPWMTAGDEWMRPDLFSAGQVSVVQAPFEQYASFNATNLSGIPRPAERAGYAGTRDLSTVARRLTTRILTEHFAMGKNQVTIFSGARTVDGHPGWLEKFRLDFTDAAARNWKFRADTVAILLVDTGSGHLDELWVSVPDTFVAQGDVDQVLASVKIP